MPFVLIFVLLVAAVDLLFGFLKGMRKVVAGIATIVLSAITSLILTPVILRAILTEEFALSLVDMLGAADTYSEIMQVSPSLQDLMLGVPVAIVGPILFIALYFFLRIIFRIATGIVTKCVWKFDEKAKKSRLIGLGLGALQGILSSMVIVFIIAGFVGTVNNVTDVILEQESDQLEELQMTVAEVDSYINIVADDPIVSIFDNNFVYNSLTSFKFGDDKAVLGKEITSIVEAGVYLTPLTENSEMANWSDAELDALDTFVDKFGSSKILTQVSAEVLSSACAKWANGEEFLGMTAPNTDPMIEPLVKALYGSMSTSTRETIVEDLGTVVDILRVIDKHDIFSKLSDDSGDITSYLSGAFVSDFMKSISGNERFSVLVPEITNLSMRMLASAMNLPENVEEIYNNITTDLSVGLNEALSSGDEESIKKFTEEVTSTLKGNGIEVTDEVADIVASNMVSAFEGKENVTADDIKEYFNDYAEIYGSIESTQTETAARDDGVVKLSTASSGESFTGEVDYANLSHAEKLVALAEIKLYDHFSAKYDISFESNVLANGMTAGKYLDYIFKIYNSITENYSKISELGDSNENPIISLKSSETIKTTTITASDLMVDSGNYTVSEEEIENIANGFEKITSFIDSYQSMDESLSIDNVSNLDLESAGAALDFLGNTSLLGDKVGVVADALVSEMVGTNINVSEKVNEGGTSYESLMTTVKATSNVISNMSKEDCTDEEKEEAIVDLLLNLTEETSGIVSEIVTPDFMIDQGVPKANSESSAAALRIALVEMAKLPEDEHDAEAAKLKYLFELTSASKGDKAMVGQGGVFETEEDIVDMVVESKVARITLKEISVDKNGAEVRDALGVAGSLSKDEQENLSNILVERYNEDNSLADTLNCIILLFDLDLTL